MTVSRHYSEYLEKDNIAEIDDLYNITSKTEAYRARKVADLRREHDLVMRNIKRVSQQRSAYLRDIDILESTDDMATTMPVIKNSHYDTGTPDLISDPEVTKTLLIRKPSDVGLNFIREQLRENVPEIDIKLRDYDYQLLKLSWREKKLTYYLTNLLKKEATSQQVTV